MARINLLKDDCEIKDALDSLQNIYHTHPLRDWNSRVESIGYQKFFKYAVTQTHEITSGNIENFINALEK